MITHHYPGKFIVIEGLDGSGKSVQVDLLVNFLRGKGKEVVVTKEPTMESEAGRTIKKVLKGEIHADPMERQRLFVQDRKAHLEHNVIPALQEGKFVVCSRYAFSTIAYGASDGLDVNTLIEMNKDFLLPDATIVINVSPEECIRRIEQRGEHKELFEKKEKLMSVDKVYQKLPILFANVMMVNGENSVEQVSMELKKIVLSQFFSEGKATMEKDFSPPFEQLSFTEEEKHLISPFFTNLDTSVFGVTFLPPEVIGALCSRTSRAKEDLRIALLKEYVAPFLEVDEEELKRAQKTEKEIDELKKYAESLNAFIHFLHEHPIDQIFSNPKARAFYIKWLAEFGDDSIAQMAGAHLVFAGISQLAIKQIEDMRIGLAPIEKSTRYVDYSSKVAGSYRYYTDPTLAELGLLEEYQSTMDHLFETYVALMRRYMEFLKAKYPAEEERVLKTKAFDTVRTILPVSTLSQLALFGNGQAFEYMINRCLDHDLGEVRWSAQRSLDELSKFIPAFLRRVGTDEAKRYRTYLSGRSKRVAEALLNLGIANSQSSAQEPPVKLLEFDADGENKIIAGLVYRETHDPFAVALGKVRGLSEDQKETILGAALKNRTMKYYKTPRAFENTFVRFEIVMNIGAWRDLHRHRMHTQDRQRFTINNGFDVPAGLKEAGLDSQFIEAVLRAEKLFKKVEANDKDLAQYCCVMAHRVRFQQYQNMRAFFWEAELRTIAQGHPDYRKIEQEKIRLIQKVYPLLSKYLIVDMNDYDFARRGDSVKIKAKEEELRQHLNKV